MRMAIGAAARVKRERPKKDDVFALKAKGMPRAQVSSHVRSAAFAL